MAGKRLFTIAEKEFFDHVRSRKFLLIFGILLVVAIVGMIGGIAEYNKSLDQYNKHQSAIQSPLSSYMPVKPSILSVFSSVATYLVFVGGVLGIAMGFDLVSKEKESKSLKILLSHPVYRDEVINGKALGGILALAGALGVVLFIALATLLVYGIVPDGNELVLIAVFAVVSFLLIFSYFAIALFLSTAMDESGSALIYTIIIFIVLSVLVPTLSNNTVTEFVIGGQPELPQELLDQMQVTPRNSSENSAVVFSTKISAQGSSDAWDRFNERMNTYWEKRQAMHDTLALLSPTMNYESITSSITNGISGNTLVMSAGSGMTTNAFSVSRTGDAGIGDKLGKIAANIIALLLFPSVFFGLAYIRFMRLDVR
ncbi:ABC transporter permease [Methanoregula sp.]|uniref:ABC transporter permease n=1 Tax=Methanoregula sp. TaxID=2052170 RepID=UPI0035657F85